MEWDFGIEGMANLTFLSCCGPQVISFDIWNRCLLAVTQTGHGSCYHYPVWIQAPSTCSSPNPRKGAQLGREDLPWVQVSLSPQYWSVSSAFLQLLWAIAGPWACSVTVWVQGGPSNLPLLFWCMMNCVLSNAPANISQLKPLFLGYWECHSAKCFVSWGEKKAFWKGSKVFKAIFLDVLVGFFYVQKIVYPS